MERDFTVQLLIDSTYQVIDNEWDVQFQGSLADCNAWLQLNDKGYFVIWKRK